ncbi:ATP-binding protein [Mesorhizobium tamadayense]|uniref:ATP-binding protein n=1 Tax=Mesorhizobium tamadayense TaxID=425306 RepID=UPI00247ABD1B|nr:ATP-binding protein [Mesorhizobium tamadayense]
MLYLRVPRLFEDLALAWLDGRIPRLIDKLTRVQLLVLDDFGTDSLTDQQRFHLFEIDRREGPTSPTPYRIVNAHRIVLQGDTMRKQKQPPS